MKPVTVLSNRDFPCASFIWPDELHYFVGYRFVEHQPKTTAEPLGHPPSLPTSPPPPTRGEYARADGWLDNWETAYVNQKNPLHLSFKTFADGSAAAHIIENDGLQERQWRFVPEENGVRIWMTLTTKEHLPGAFILQQCLRFGSGIGYGLYPTISQVPFLSELLMQVLGNANGTMTWIRQDESWRAVPVPFTRYHTAVAPNVYEDSTSQIDCGLIVRETPSREQAPQTYWQAVAPAAKWKTWTAGLYWERTAYVSNRHPADCLHAGVDFGPLAAGDSRTLQGKFYWLEGTKEDLFDIWLEEFQSS